MADQATPAPPAAAPPPPQQGGGGDFSQQQGGGGDFSQGMGGDFSSLGDGGAPSTAAGGAAKGGAGLFGSFWQATQRVANDVGAGGVFDSVNKKVNQLKASQLGDKMEMLDKDEEFDKLLANIKETGIRYRELLQNLSDRTEYASRCAGPLRRSGAALIRCAGISDKVARDLASGGGAHGFFKETPTFEADLNEALLVSSAAFLYSADRAQALNTTAASLEQSRAAFEQGTYSTKYYVKREQFGVGPIDAALNGIAGLVKNEITSAEGARRKYMDLRMDMSVRGSEARLRGESGQLPEEEVAQLAVYKEDVRSAHRTLVAAKEANMGVLLKGMVEAEREAHEQALKSLTATMSALPNGPVGGVRADS
mmetsp:Transcript_487/g.1016  ORF Transcript_487/g.1016 Transcript_487/m.1016 type:complete len:367 (+) Transcript_487:58-1158(+)